ncbi:ribonucleotide reductase of class Ib (aerobic), alpha subunit [Staphylococcus phage PALS_2]|nr:ribonucleotide reductase of class Ib (aerobic), alpha subunit [Staphylococcus phage PALS_2]BDE75558.1 ribonucleoside-diphosphate reductase [Staphylococcus phage S6]
MPKEIDLTSEKFKDYSYNELNSRGSQLKDGNLDLEFELASVKKYFLDSVNKNVRYFKTYKEKINYLVDNDYIDGDMISNYDFEFIKGLMKELMAYKHRFTRLLGAKKFYEQYAMKDDAGEILLELYEDRILFVALYLADGDEELARNIANEIITGTFQPATPTFLNAGRVRSGELVSCFLLTMEDSLSSIYRNISNVAQLSKRGGGIGVSLSNLRADNDPIKGVEGAASGVVPVMKVFEDTLSYVNQLGQRNGAGALYLNIFHKDVVKFLDTKKENADEKVRLKTISLGLTVPDKYYQLVKENKSLYTFSPYDIKKYYDLDFDSIDFNTYYDIFVDDKRISKEKMYARDLETTISKLQQESGYPYIINIDTANRANPISHGTIKMSNLCSEILQVQYPSLVDDNQQYVKTGTDVSCNLASTIVPGLMKSEDFGKSVGTMLRSLNSVAEKSNIEAVPTVKKANDLFHTVGLGAMGLHTYLAENHIQYGSEESKDFTNIYFMLLNYWTLVESNKIAKEKDESFYLFDKTEYADGSYFDKRYIGKNIQPRTEKVKELFEDIFIPSDSDWEQLRNNIVMDGLYNQNRLAVAPNGSIGYVREVSPSIHPIVELIEERVEGKTGTTFYPAPGITPDNFDYFKKNAYQLDMRDMIDLYSEAQYHVDQGISMNIYLMNELDPDLYEWKKDSLDKETTTRDISRLRNYAYSKGIKSMYYTRIYSPDHDENSQGIVECESCSI